jgi:hypothetical protein
MPDSTLNTAEPAFVPALADALRHDMAGATVEYECLRPDRYRFIVVWSGFENLGHPERQRRVWKVADQVVPGADMLSVGMILAVTPDEAQSSP